MKSFAVAVAALIISFVFPPFAKAQNSGRSLLANFNNWKPIASEGVTIHASAQTSASGAPGMRIDFDFTNGAGYGGVSLDLPLQLPENYEFAFDVYGKGPANNLEFKLVDPSGLNVWWVIRRAFEWPAEATHLSNRRRHFQFAWGPAGASKPLAKLGHIELIISANEGGRGSVWIEDLRFKPLAPETPYTGTPRFSSSSAAPAGLPWVADENDKTPRFAVDFEQPRDLGGVVISRPSDRAPGRFRY